MQMLTSLFLIFGHSQLCVCRLPSVPPAAQEETRALPTYLGVTYLGKRNPNYLEQVASLN